MAKFKEISANINMKLKHCDIQITIDKTKKITRQIQTAQCFSITIMDRFYTPILDNLLNVLTEPFFKKIQRELCPKYP